MSGYGITDGADISASNFNISGKTFLATLSFPVNNYVNFTFGASGTNYLAPADGYIYLQTVNNGTGPVFAQIINSSIGISIQNQLYSAYGTITLFVPVFKYNNFVINYSSDVVCQIFRFIYAKGAQ